MESYGKKYGKKLKITDKILTNIDKIIYPKKAS